MSRYHSYLNSAVQIIGRYTGEEPFANFLKKYFAQDKKFGSKDRKQISHLCYCYFRLGKSAPELPVDKRILLGLFLCSNEPTELLKELRPEWDRQTGLPIEEKRSVINTLFSFSNVFPWSNELSEGIAHEKFCTSFFIQPCLFLRLRPGKENSVRQKIQKTGIAFDNCAENCIAFPNASRVDTLLELNKEAVIQDYSSQKTGEFLSPVGKEGKSSVWDCCAASGGKSIMVVDILGSIDLTVSDIRESILVNLKKRFAEAGIKKYKSFVADLSGNTGAFIPNSPFDLIIADVPCTGSGTWGRTPEQLFYFERTEIDRYAALQKKIVTNVIPHLKPGGYLLYCTCSVFKKENEEAVSYMAEKLELEIKRVEVIKGYDKKADTMFAALLQKNL